MSLAAQQIQFETNSSKLKAESYPILDNVVRIMGQYPDYKLSIEGHTDSQGDDALNMKLSTERAQSAAAYLISKGIDSGRLVTKGFGETMPIADNNTAEGRAQNRRVEFKLFR